MAWQLIGETNEIIGENMISFYVIHLFKHNAFLRLAPWEKFQGAPAKNNELSD